MAIPTGDDALRQNVSRLAVDVQELVARGIVEPSQQQSLQLEANRLLLLPAK